MQYVYACNSLTGRAEEMLGCIIAQSRASECIDPDNHAALTTRASVNNIARRGATWIELEKGNGGIDTQIVSE